LNSQIKRAILILSAGALMAGCRATHPSSATQPAAMAQPVDPNAGVVVKKPFIALPNLPFTQPAQPTVLLVQHARSDSPIPLSQYSKQQVHSLDSFDLRASLSADELQKHLGLPAQLADYSNPWFVYRLAGGRELWLNFSQPDNAHLLAADEIIPVEDGYTRKRLFSIDDSH